MALEETTLRLAMTSLFSCVSFDSYRYYHLINIHTTNHCYWCAWNPPPASSNIPVMSKWFSKNFYISIVLINGL
jgi:hypothetical protein